MSRSEAELKQTDWLHDEATQTLLTAFKEAGCEIRFVGGCVRDALLGTPVHDIDAATPALPEEVIQLCENAWIKTIPTGIKHGTVTAIVQHVQFEITTLRKDVDCDGRHAEVSYTDSWEEDALRRDFTMNALYCDGEGQVYDYTDGVVDAYAGRIRFIGDAEARIQEDALRILRFFRFFASHGTPPVEERGLEACQKHAKLLRKLSGERVCQEMLKLLSTEDPLPALKAMIKTESFDHVNVPEVLPNALENLISLAPNNPWLRLACILRHAYDKDAAFESLCYRWKISNQERKLLEGYLEELPPLREVSDNVRLRTIRRHGKDIITGQLYLQWAEEKNAQDLADNVLALLDTIDHEDIPQFPVSGSDLIAMGIKSGPEIGQKLSALEASWEASDFQMSKEELLEQIGG